MSELPIDAQTDYEIISAVITNSDRSPDFEADIKRLISSFQIFEHIDNPYLTAEVVFADTNNVVQDIDFQGGEKLTLSLAQAEEINEGSFITKEFLIDRIEKIIKTDLWRKGKMKRFPLLLTLSIIMLIGVILTISLR